jgi:hypothetical protein
VYARCQPQIPNAVPLIADSVRLGCLHHKSQCLSMPGISAHQLGSGKCCKWISVELAKLSAKMTADSLFVATAAL